MNFIELFLLAVGLAMDAFAVAICKGLSMEKATPKNMAITGAWFGGFQALMPALGYLLGTGFQDYIESIDHWIAFGLLAVIGLSMIKESIKKDETTTKENSASLAPRLMAVLALATSVDALAVGITFAFLHVNIVAAVIIIGIVTFVISGLGVKLGNLFGEKYKKGAGIAGGVILILLGTKILLEHLGIIP